MALLKVVMLVFLVFAFEQVYSQTLSPGVSLQETLDRLQAEIDFLENSFGSYSGSLTNILNQQVTASQSINALNRAVGTLQNEVNSLKKGQNKLEKTNDVWKNNFKIVNTTFTALRQKIAFKIIPFRYTL